MRRDRSTRTTRGIRAVSFALGRSSDGAAEFVERIVKRLRRVGRLRCRCLIIEMPFDPRFELSRRGHCRRVEQAYDARIGPKFCENVVEDERGLFFRAPLRLEDLG